jgi:hypothetical protein
MPFDELADRLDRWALSYNFERANAAVGGLTPFDSWCERIDAGDTVTRASNRELAALSLPVGKTATKQKNGVTPPGSAFTYSGRALVGVRNGTTYALGQWINDDRHLEIFDPTTGAYIATLERTSDMSGHTEGAIVRARARERETVKTTLAEMARRHRIENGPTPARPAPAAEPEPTAAAADPAHSADDAAPLVGRHAVPVAAAVDAAATEDPADGTGTELAVAPPADPGVLPNPFAAQLAAAAARQATADTP